MNAADLDEYLERTVRFDGLSIPPEACRQDDGPTVSVPAPAMAALAAKSALATRRRAAWSGYPPSDATAVRRGDSRSAVASDSEMRLAVIGIWMVAAFLFATLGILVR